MTNYERVVKQILNNDSLSEEKKEELYNYLSAFEESLVSEQIKEIQKGIEKHKEKVKIANREYHDYLASQGFEFIEKNDCYYWTNYLAVHKDYIERVKEYGREYYDLEEGLKPIPDWAIIEVPKEVYNF